MWGNVLLHSHMCTLTHLFIVMCVPVLCESQSLDQDSVMLDTVYTEQKGMSRQGENINQDKK